MGAAPGVRSGAEARGRGSVIRDAPRVKRQGRGAEFDKIGLIEGTRDLVVVSRDQREQVPVAYVADGDQQQASGVSAGLVRVPEVRVLGDDHAVFRVRERGDLAVAGVAAARKVLDVDGVVPQLLQVVDEGLR